MSSTHCKNGHELTEASTFISKRARGKEYRGCRLCRRDNSRKIRLKNKLPPVEKRGQINGPSKYRMIGQLTDNQFNTLDILHQEGSMECSQIAQFVFDGNLALAKRRITDFKSKGLITGIVNPLPVEPERNTFYRPTNFGKQAYRDALLELESR